MLLTDKVVLPDISPSSDDPESYLYDSLGTIFPDDTWNQHGDPGSSVTYKSARFGDIKLHLADPQAEDGRKLFAHFVWNAGIWLAEALSSSEETEKEWDVQDETVIELGAGTGLGGIVSSLCGAKESVLSDYPAPEILDNLFKNVTVNIPSTNSAQPTVEGHSWGNLIDDFSLRNKGRFTRVLAADCFWMPQQHTNLLTSMNHFLSSDPSSRIYAIAGFHTGRVKVAAFFDAAEEAGLEVEFIEEVDVLGNVRPWAKERDGGRENITERKRWLVTARLKRRAQWPIRSVSTKKSD